MNTNLELHNKKLVLVSIFFVGIVIFVSLVFRGQLHPDTKTTDLSSLESAREQIIEIDNPSAEDRTETGPEIISYRDAFSHVGERKIIEGELKTIVNNGKAVILGFSDPHRGSFKVMIEKEYWSNFESSPDNIYKIGDNVRVQGKVEWYQGDPTLYASNQSQITINSN